RAKRAEIELELQAVSARRREAEEALAARSSRREELSRRTYAAQSAADRVGYRADSVRAAQQTVGRRLEQSSARLERLLEEQQADRPDPQADARIEALSRELEALERDREAELARQLQELELELEQARALLVQRTGAVEAALAARERAEAEQAAARERAREAERALEAARRESARVGGELAAVNQFLRAHQPAPGGARSLADELRVTPGYEVALAAALDGRLGAALLDDRSAAGELLDRAGRDGGRVLVLKVRARDDDQPEAARAPVAGATPLADHVFGESDAAAVARRLLRDVWVLDDLDAVADGFAGVAVTPGGRVYSGRSGELRQAPRVGEERVLAERNRRDELIAASERAAGAEHAARETLEAVTAAAAASDAARAQALAAHRAALDALDEARERERRALAAIARRRDAPDEGPGAERRAQLQVALAAERAARERATRERSAREAQIARLRAEIERDQALLPRIGAIQAALAQLAAAIGEQRAAFEAQLARDREAGESVAAQLRACAQQEAAIQARLHAAGEELTGAEVRSQRARDQQADAARALAEVASELGLEPSPAEQPLSQERCAELRTRLERLARRREQLGPVNPLAQDQYAEALAHVEELEAQRTDLETALRELQGLIRDTDREIRETFEETFEAAARNFEELAARVFPGGSGRLRLVKDSELRAPLVGARDQDGAGAGDPQAGDGVDGEPDDEDAQDGEDLLGVEIEITPAGKAMKRLTLLSGGEKSMTALAFLFAVFLARPCPFYILDEVEAALDDLNITRFLDLLETYSERAQFIVVTHQKRTMEAADSLYGVSMGGDGVSKVVSRRLPAREAIA
ncbi:MAG TPA: AAA family ATPase, partial [Solirubrobacteraceae bacterium]|nr:AAA family ATPase [Solirubrobacteraceae bacterium]